MPFFIGALLDVVGPWLSRLIASRIGAWVLQGLLFFGISFVSTKFESSFLMQPLASKFSAMGSDYVAWCAYCWVDRCITVVISAYATASAYHWIVKRTPKS